ncbi:hypothetical protein F2Q70_00040357 [Brassica cretica]|uniref:Uncharacterized protein n=1 Tax=Brassica cretica TaxID=69181 RepID=A0A8S9K4T1_BRACR|nr:hypothetical protein F2Q70_00040357 [Brassica cretica]KAF2619378.1 hypothetical protein F2Q68_00041025 [Brassica cretica]
MSKTCSNLNKEYSRVAHASIAFTISINAGAQRTTHRKPHLPPESSRNSKLHCLFRLQSSPPNQSKCLKHWTPPGTQSQPPPRKPPPTTVLEAKCFIS